MRIPASIIILSAALAALPGRFVLAAAPAAVPQDIASALAAAAFPDDDGLFVRQSLDIVVDADGKVTRTTDNAIKVLGQWPIAHGYFDPSLSWNNLRSTLKVDQARTYTADGRVVEAKANSFVENTAGALEGATPYAYIRQMTVAQVGVEEGGVTELGFTIADRAPSGAPLWGVVPMDGAMPMLDQRVTFTTPAGVEVRWAGLSCSLTPRTETSGGATRLVFERRRVPGVNTAEAADGRTGLCRLVYSTARDWASARSFLERGIEPALAADAVVQAKARDIAGAAALDAERIARVHAFVVDGIQTVRWPLDAFDYAARPAADVLQSSVGHSLDKAALLVAMLRALGYDANVALVAGERGVPLDVAAAPLLEDAWVVVNQGPHGLWLDPTTSLDKRNQHHIAGRAALVLDGKATAPVVLPDLDPSSNRAAVRVDLKVEDGGHELRLSGAEDLDLGGLYNPCVAFDRAKDRVAGVASGFAAAFGGAKATDVVVGWKSTQLTALHATVSGGALPASREGAPVRLLLPRVPGAIAGDALQLYRTRRTLPLSLPAPAEEQVSVTLTLPEKLTASCAPGDLKLDNAAGTLTREVRKDGRKLTVTTTLRLKTAVVAPDAYDGLRQLFAAVDAEPARTILLTRAKDPD